MNYKDLIKTASLKKLNKHWYSKTDQSLRLHIFVDATSITSALFDTKLKQWSAGPEITKDNLSSEEDVFEILENIICSQDKKPQGLAVIVHTVFNNMSVTIPDAKSLEKFKEAKTSDKEFLYCCQNEPEQLTELTQHSDAQSIMWSAIGSENHLFFKFPPLFKGITDCPTSIAGIPVYTEIRNAVADMQTLLPMLSLYKIDETTKPETKETLPYLNNQDRAPYTIYIQIGRAHV